MSLRIALVGYGKMGKAVEAEARARGHEICLIVDQDNAHLATLLRPETCDCFIEFTRPEAALGNFRNLLSTGVPIVTGTTGWLPELETFQAEVLAANGRFMYSNNFSVGVNVLFQLNKMLAKLMNGHPQYDCYIEEAHHRHKKDAPSGTAQSLAGQILDGLNHKTKLAGPELLLRAPEPEELSIAFTRAGEIIGNHSVTYISDIDRITIQHEAFNRRGFALGAVIAAEWMQGKRGFFEFGQIFETIQPF
ncbi:MAG: 4-hydroxy-tetrahydrodipicolinate reductase [Bacteroidetes bacterium]|nr:4-hydroxy-tetrahydrodipicolinate reductase [Bacteroidota bacterium]